MLNDKYRCIFIHIPKTAGNSINRCFGVGWENHKDLQRIMEEVGRERCLAYHRFAVVRNPWDRLLSDYNYQKRKSRPDHSRLHLFDAHGEVRTFGGWVKAVFEDPFRCPPKTWGGDVSSSIHRWSPQVDWLTIDGRMNITTLLRMESLSEGFSALQRVLGMPVSKLPRRNWRFHWHYSKYYDPELRSIVGQYYARDIEAFGYQFETPKNDVAWFLSWIWSMRPRPQRSSDRLRPNCETQTARQSRSHSAT